MTIEPNPYNVFEVRRAEFPPDHFEYANIPLNYNMKDALERWVDFNLKSRFYLGKNVVLDNNNKMAYNVKIGFEDPKELSYFMLACPHLKYK
jgi:hypothetical protein